jgi:hypothetical protein
MLRQRKSRFPKWESKRGLPRMKQAAGVDRPPAGGDGNAAARLAGRSLRRVQHAKAVAAVGAHQQQRVLPVGNFR